MKAVAGAPLTGRELEMAARVAQGMTDAQIAREFTVSLRTVHAHLTHIYVKTGIRSRSRLAIDYLGGRFERNEERVPNPNVPVRLTVDLDPDLYRMLTRWALGTAESLGMPRVMLTDALRAMIRATIEEPAVDAIVQTMITRSADSRREARS